MALVLVVPFTMIGPIGTTKLASTYEMLSENLEMVMMWRKMLWLTKLLDLVV